MINKKIFYFIAIFIAIIAATILLPSNVNAVTISEDGTYNIAINDPYDDVYTNGNHLHVISFNFDEGEDAVSVEELTKGLDVFSYGRKFIGWKEAFDHNNEPVQITELKKSDFGGYTIIGNTKIENCYLLAPIFEKDIPVNSGTYYLVINSFWGSVNGKDIEVVKNASSSFDKVDLTKYVPTDKNATFLGWSINGEEFVNSISAEEFKKSGKDVIEVIGIWKPNTFTEGLTQNFRLDANGGTIDSEATKLYNWYAPSSMYPCYLLGYAPKRDGYIFKGWNTKSDGTGKKLITLYWEDIRDPKSAGYDIDAEGFLKLYATWEKVAETQKPENNKVEELSTKVEGTTVEIKVELEKAVEEGSKLQIIKVAEEKIEEVKKVKEDLKTVFDINVVSNTGDIIKIEDNKMQIKILLEETLRGYKNYQVVYIKDGKIVEEMPTKIEGNYIVFETTHLSEYGIIANNNEKGQETVEETKKPQEETQKPQEEIQRPQTNNHNKEEQEVVNNPQNPQTGDNVVVFGMIFMIALTGLAISMRYNSNKIKLKKGEK